jgi:hypothetical protein
MATEKIFYKILVVVDPSRRKTRGVENSVDWMEVDLPSESVDQILETKGCCEFVYRSSGDDVEPGFSRVWIHEFVGSDGLTALIGFHYEINKDLCSASMVGGPTHPTCAGFFRMGGFPQYDHWQKQIWYEGIGRAVLLPCGWSRAWLIPGVRISFLEEVVPRPG